MHRRKNKWSHLIATVIGTVGVTVTAGCGLLRHLPEPKHDTTASYSDGHGLQIEYPDVQECATPVTVAASATTRPLTLEDPAELPTIDMSLEEAINLAVTQSPVLRSIGGTVVTAPAATSSVYDPALTAASPVQGAEAALAAFDAQYTQSLFWNNLDIPNNAAVFGVPLVTTGKLSNFSGDLSKTTATGAVFSLRHVVDYDRTNSFAGGRRFSSAFAGWIEAEWRQPLLQGAGVTFNRIAGPTNIPGQYNGVLIARLNEDTSLADFEAAVINLVSDVEQAYWDLVTAYRVLDTQIKGRSAALQTFQYQQVRLEVGSGRSDEEAQARSQYYQFQAQVEAALGSAGGLYPAEQRLRYLIGYPATDGRLIRPSTDPTDAKIVYDFESALGQALERRVEVRRQRIAVQRRELELTAARLNLKPRLDVVASYRWRGLGDNLLGGSGQQPILDSLYGEIFGGNFQEGRAGVELSFPVGFRAAATALAHARLGVQRERAVLAETELGVSHDLSDAARQVEITYRLVETNYNRVAADLRQVEVLQRRYKDGSDNINFLLQAQRQAVTSTTEFYRSLSQYNLALRDFHREKGSLLAYNQVQMAEGPWAAGAQNDAYEVGRFLHPRPFPHKARMPKPLTSGPFDPSAPQSTAPPMIGAEPIDAGTMEAAPLEAAPMGTQPIGAGASGEETMVPEADGAGQPPVPAADPRTNGGIPGANLGAGVPTRADVPALPSPDRPQESTSIGAGLRGLVGAVTRGG